MRTRDQTISGVYDTYSGSSGRRPNKSLHSLSHCSQQYQRRPGTSRLSRTSTTTKASRRSVWPSTYPSVGLWNRGYQNFIWKNKSVAVYERRRKHGTMAGRGEWGRKATFTYPLRIAFQSARNCALWIIGSEGCIYVKYRSTRRSWTCIGGIATSCSSCSKCATSSMARGHLRTLGRCHTPPITGK